MAPDIKFCGLTRAEDAAAAVAMGASHVGVIFAGGPRHRTVEQAREVLAPVPETVARVGVFAGQSADEILEHAGALALDVVQLHQTGSPDRIDALMAAGLRVWPVYRLRDGEVPADLGPMARRTDAVLVEAAVAGALGGTGVPLHWEAVASPLGAALRDGGRLVLAGGLRPENVAPAIQALRPTIVDVSSGVESAPGIKDHDRMRAFRDAVRGTTES